MNNTQTVSEYSANYSSVQRSPHSNALVKNSNTINTSARANSQLALRNHSLSPSDNYMQGLEMDIKLKTNVIGEYLSVLN